VQHRWTCKSLPASWHPQGQCDCAPFEAPGGERTQIAEYLRREAESDGGDEMTYRALMTAADDVESGEFQIPTT
jgi:hypothetical protein